MNIKHTITLIILSFASTIFASVDKNKVYIVALESNNDSQKVAKYYASSRNIPEENIIYIDSPTSGIVSRKDYFEKIETPILKSLIEKKAVSAIFTGEKTFDYRDDFTFISHDVDFLVLCWGVPWGVSALPINVDHTDDSQNQNPKIPKGMKSNQSSVDSELAALFLKQKSLDGFIKNPLYGNLKNPNAYKSLGVLRVARLDGVTADDACNIVKSSMSAEEKGLRGRVYIDKANKYKQGEDWLDKSTEILTNLGFDVSVDKNSATMGLDSRSDGLAMYFGWYSSASTGYFREPNFKVNDGAIGLHIFSFSAKNMRNKFDWTPALISKNFAMTVGNVFEPYLGLTHHPHVMAAAIASNLTVGEAGYASIGALSWQNILVCDPLYCPMKKTIKEQLVDIENGKVDELSQYVIIRFINSIIKTKPNKLGIAVAMKYLDKLPDNTALLWKISQLYAKDGDFENADKLASSILTDSTFKNIQYWGLIMEIADYFESKNPQKSKDIYNKLLDYEISSTLKSLIDKKLNPPVDENIEKVK